MFRPDPAWNTISWAETALPCVGGRQVGFFPVLGPGGQNRRDFGGSNRDGICEGFPGSVARLDDPRHVLQLQAGRRQLWLALTQHIGSVRLATNAEFRVEKGVSTTRDNLQVSQ